jgi:hypothetical protein
VLTGRLPRGGPDWVYLPVAVPPGVGELAVRYDHDPGGRLDLGLFAPAGDPGDLGAFRGWSGSARRELALSPLAATPGYLAGPIWPGTWHVLLGPVRVPPAGLGWRVEVALRPPRGARTAPAARAAPRPPRGSPGWYRGDLHTHTVHSDGSYLPAELGAAARAAGLDFLASTEHNTCAAHAAWAAAAPAGLLVLNGQEVTTRAGHFGAVGLRPGALVDWRYRPGDGRLAAAVAGLRARGGLMVVNHPCAPGADGWGFGYDAADAVEVWNGAVAPPANDAAIARWDRLLHVGRRLAAVAGSDAHRPPDRVGGPQTVVWAGRLAPAELLAGLRAGRAYLAAGAAVALDLSAWAGGRRAGLGGTLRGRLDEPVQVRLRARGAAGAQASLHDRGGVVARLDAGGADWTTRLGGHGFVRVELRRPGGELVALCNPIWLEPRP